MPGKLSYKGFLFLKASNWNDDPAGKRWINSDLIGFTQKMNNIKACRNQHFVG